MKTDNLNNTTDRIEEEILLDRMLDGCRFEPCNRARIKALVHERIEADQKETRRRFRRNFTIGLSAAASLILITVLGLKFISSPASETSYPAKLASANFIEVKVPTGSRQEIKLPDGSTIIANSQTIVRYPEKFEGDERRIYACGEVYLQVTKDRKHPFVVESEGFNVRVLGTTFNICNTTDSTANVVLVEGAVEIAMKNDQHIRLKPNDKAELLNGEITSLTQINAWDYTSWTKGVLNLQGVTLTQIAHNLSDYYGVEIECNRKLEDVKLYGKLYLNDNVDSVINSIREITPMRVSRHGNRIILNP